MESIFHWSIATLLDPLHWGTSIFWREIGLILYVGASNERYGDHWMISCCSHYILRHSHLVGCFGIETWLSVYDCCFWWIMELLKPWVQSSWHTWMILDTYLPFISYSNISPLILSCFLSYQSLIITFFFYPTHLTMTHDLTPLSQLEENVDQSSISLVVFSYIFWTLGSTSSMMEMPNRLLIY